MRWRSGSRPAGARTGPELVPALESLVAERPLEERPARIAHARPVQGGPAGRRSRRVPRRQAGARRRAGSRAGRAASRARARDPPPGPCAIGCGGGRAVQLDRRSIGATGRARATPSTRRGARPWSSGRELILAQIVQPAEIASATRTLDEARRDLRARGAAVRVAAFSSSSPAEDVVRLDAPGCRPAAARRRGDPSSSMFAVVFAEAACDVAAMVEWGWNQ